MKRNLLFSVMLFCGAVSMAQTSAPDTDVTPPLFRFGQLPVGPYAYTFTTTQAETSNPPALFQDAVSDAGGATYLFGWEKFCTINGVDDPTAKYMREATNILDMGGEVGKVLCIKGHNCTDDVFPYGVKPASWPGGWFGWPSMAFYFGNKMNGVPYEDKMYKARFKIVFRAVLPADKYTDQVQAMTYSMKVFAGDVLAGVDQVKGYSSDTEDEDTWYSMENDFEFKGGDDKVTPLNLKFGLPDEGYTFIGALLIKEMKLTINPTGEPENKTFTFVSNPPTGIAKNEVAGINYKIEGNTLMVNNLKDGEIVSLYNNVGILMGQKTVSSQSATLSIDGKGIFYLRAGNKKAIVIK